MKTILASSTGPLAGALAHAASLKHLAPLVSRALPQDLAAHCQPGNLRGNSLVMFADSPAWAAKLRFHAPQLLRNLQREPGLSGLQRCEVRVLPASRPGPSKRPAAAPISARSREQLRQTAANFRDPRLKEAILRLANSESQGK